MACNYWFYLFKYYNIIKEAVSYTHLDWSDNVLDCCCGTGTIPKAALQIKKSKIGIRNAIKTVWACDKYKYPLQVANISMTDSESINLANRLFQHNALTLETGEKIQIINPETGKMMNLNLPSFCLLYTSFLEF